MKAQTYYTYQDNGLLQPWYGNVFLNPPYINGVIGKFIDKLITEIALGQVKQAILLVHNSSGGTKWFNKATTASKYFCLPSKRILFWSPNVVNGRTVKGNKQSAPSGSIIFYYGRNVKQFEAVFKKFGIVVRTP